jgi:hypothetical protein
MVYSPFCACAEFVYVFWPFVYEHYNSKTWSITITQYIWLNFTVDPSWPTTQAKGAFRSKNLK